MTMVSTAQNANSRFPEPSFSRIEPLVPYRKTLDESAIELVEELTVYYRSSLYPPQRQPTRPLRPPISPATAVRTTPKAIRLSGLVGLAAST